MAIPDTLFEVFPVKTALCLLWTINKVSAEFHKLRVVASFDVTVEP